MFGRIFLKGRHRAVIIAWESVDDVFGMVGGEGVTDGV
jgi:hypothetical protein